MNCAGSGSPLRPIHALLPTAFAAVLGVHLAAQSPMLAGRVRTRNGEPAAMARLVLRWRAAPELPGLCGITLGDAGVEQMEAAADGMGTFKIALPHRGPFELIANLGEDRSTPLFPVMAGAYVALQLAPMVTVGGRVVDANEQPVAGVAVQLVPESTAWSKLAAYRAPEVRGHGRTSADGGFVVPFQDTYLRRAQWEPFSLLDFDVDGVASLRLELLRPTAHCRDLVIQLVPAERADRRAPRARPADSQPAAAGAPVNLRARLVRGKRPIADAPVLWSCVAAGARTPPSEVRSQTDKEGQVTLADGPPCAAVFGFVRIDGTWTRFHADRAPSPESPPLGDVEVATHAVSGGVVDATGQPVPGARIVALPFAALAEELPYVTFSDHGGRYRFEALPDVPMLLWADCGTAGFASTLLAKGQREATLATPAGGVVEGEVVDAEGRPFAGAWLVLVRRTEGGDTMPGISRSVTNLCVQSDANGQVRITGLPEGPWQVSGNAIRDGDLWGNGTDVQTGGTFRLALRHLKE